MPTEEEARLFEQMMTYKEEIFQICLGFSRNASDAEDLAQEVYLKAYENVAKIYSPYAVKEWLVRVAKNTCLDHQKKRRVVQMSQARISAPQALSVPPEPPNPVESEERLRALKEAISRLPDRLREVFVLRMYGEMSYSDLARTLRIREGTVMSRLNRARAAVACSVKEALHGRRTG
jgi:RNA polymerase sigma-70 factor (ECF subfamily)